MDDHGGNHHDGSVGDAASDLMSLFRPPSSLPTTKQDGGESKQPQSGIAQAEPEPSASGVPAPSITPSVNGSYDATKMRYASSSLSSSSVPEAISKIQKPRVGLDREVTSVHSNRTSESTSLLQYSDAEVDRGTDKFVNLKQRNSNKGETTAHPSYSTAYHLDGDVHSEDKSTTTFRIDDCWKTRGVSGVMDRLAGFRRDHLGLSTYLGAAVFLLYHVVFCLAMGSTIRRPHSTTSTLGIMTKTAAMGVMLAGPIYILALYKEIPAIYPTVDLFLAPFMAQIAKTIDHHLYQQGINSTESFMATFGVVSGIGMLTAGVLILLASQFKLANLGSYLPFPVLCGFFTAVGVSMWSLAFTVDTNGQNFGVFWSGDWNLIANSVLHHAPTVLVATVMKWLGAKNPLSVSSLVVVTILLFYLVMLLTQTPLSKAVQLAWFWSAAQLVPPSHPHNVGLDSWSPPQPFGYLNAIRLGYVHWGAVRAGLSEAFTLAFLYLLRCTLHGTAMKKNVPNLKRARHDRSSKPRFSISKHRYRRFASTEHVDIEAGAADDQGPTVAYVQAKPTNVSLPTILTQYAQSVMISGLVGSFGVVPSVAASSTMYTLGAEGVAPQLGSLLLLGLIYFTNFEFVLYVPKAAFSCLIVLASLDMFITWMYRSYKKTKEKSEWLVAPLIVVFASLVGLLNAVFLGIAFSTLIFVASFFRSGVVKFLASGLTVRSTIERSIGCASWLDEYGDLVQILVLQNYLFFGNSSSILSYIGSMFEETDDQELEYDLPPLPKYIIMDLTLVTGMDTSSVDVFVDMRDICARHGCKLFVAGASGRVRDTLALGNFKPERGHRSERRVRFFVDLDTALGKAEDTLLDDKDTAAAAVTGEEEGEAEDFLGIESDESGFQLALRKIDEQHGKDFGVGLVGLEKYTTPIELEPRQCIYQCDGGVVPSSERGLFFIEAGIVKIERDSTVTLSRGARHPLDVRNHMQNRSIDNIKARFGTMARLASQVKVGGNRSAFLATDNRIRLARIGPGWVVGATEGATDGTSSSSSSSNSQVAVTKCRLHLLPFSKIQQAERDDPALILRLYKLLSHLMARRQEITVGQLITLHSIMTSPPPTKPVSRVMSSSVSTHRHDYSSSSVS